MLIVEDDEVGIKLLKSLLAKYGNCEIVLAKDGDEAVSEFESALVAGKPFDLILLDIVIPKLNGHDTLIKIRAIEDKGIGTDVCKIIMTSALNDFTNVKKAFRNQADGYLVKPITKENLFERIMKAGLNLG